AKLPERGLVGVVAVDVAERLHQPRERVAIDAAVPLDALVCARAELVERPARLGDADDRHGQPSAERHAVQGGKDLLVGEVARGAEENERVCGNCGHDMTFSMAARPGPGAVSVDSWCQDGRSKQRLPRYWSSSATSAVHPVWWLAPS